MNTLSYHLRHVNWIICVFVISALFLFYNLSAQDLSTPPYGLSKAAWQKLHTPQTMNVKNTSYFLTADEIILNGSFETGDFSDWIVQDLNDPFFPLQIGGAGISSWSEFFISEPTDGEYAVLHGFDGAGPGYITLAQDVVLDSLAAVLHFDYRAAWDLSFGAIQSRTFVINLEPSGGGEIFHSDTILVADPLEQSLIEDTGPQHGIVLLNSLPDTSIRISFEWYIPEEFTGPAFFQLDNVFVQEVSEGPEIYAFPDLINFGNIVVDDTSDIRDVRVYNIGTEDLTINDASVSDPDFHLINLPDLPLTIPAGESEIFEIFFLPTDSGLVNATLTVTSDDVDNPSVDISLSGRGIQVMPADPGICYASTGNIDGGRLMQIDPSNGTGTLIGETGLDAVPAVAINSEGKIYGLDENSGDIYGIDAASGISFLSTETGIEGLVAIAFDNSDVLYGYSSLTYELYTIDLLTGLSTFIGYTGVDLRGLAFHSLTNMLYGSGHYELYTINVTDGTTSFIGNTQLDMPITDLSFNIAGNLFATEGGANEENYLISINQSNAEGTRIGEIGFQSVSGLAFYNLPLDGRHISISPETINFGTIEVKDTTAVNVVSISNVGTEVLTVTDISTADTNVILSNLPVLPIVLPSRASQAFEVSISVSDTGVFNKTISISSDDPDKPVTNVQLNGRAIIIQSADNGLCYASTGNIDGGRLIQIDPSNGTGTLIGETGLDAVPAVAINSEGKIYGLDENSGDIYGIDAATGLALNAIQTDIDGLVAIAFDINDVLYGYSSGTSNLYTIDLQTGLFTLAGYTGTNFRGLAFHPLTNMLYGSGHYELYTINVTDGTTSFIGNTQLDMPITDLSFNIAGNLFATEGGANEENYLVSINQSNAEGTRIGEIGFQSVSGLAFYTTPLEGRHISVSPDTLDLGTIEVRDTSYVKTISISNIGTDALTVTAISASDTTVILANLPDLPLVLASRASHIIDVSIFTADTGTFNKNVSIISDDMDNPVEIVTLSGRTVIIAPADSGVWYASTGHTDGGRFISIDPATGAGTLIGSTGLDAVPAIAINSKGKIYAVGDRISSSLYRIDGQTGNAIEILNTGMSHITGLAFDRNDLLYAYSEGSNSLFFIDLERGITNLVGYTGSGFRGIAFNPTDNSLWGCQFNDIYTINTTDGVSTLIGNTFLEAPLTDIHFDILGNLFATAGGNWSANNLASIDKTTGVGSLIGEIGFETVSGLAFYNVPLDGRHLSVSPHSFDFGEVVVGDTSLVKIVMFGNIGTDDLTIENIAISDTTIILSELPQFPLVLSSLDFSSIDVSISPNATGSYDELITLTTNDPEHLTFDIPIQAEAFSISPADSGILYATTGHRDGGRLLKIDSATGQGTLIGETGLSAVPGLAINSQGEIYGVDAFEGNLYRIDAQSGRAILVGPSNVFRMIAIAFDKDDNLYGYSDNFGSLYEINPQTGSSELVVEIGYGFRGLAFNPTDNSLWASNWNMLYIIDPSDGTSQIVASTSFQSGIPAIHFDILGNLHGIVHLEWSSSQLFFTDVKTRHIGIIGDIGFEAVSGLAFFNVPRPGSHLHIYPKSIDFGLTAVGDTAISRSIDVYNLGTEDLIIDEISVEKTSFILSDISSLPWTLSTGESRTFGIAHAPVNMGSDTSTIEIVSNDSEDPAHYIGLSGEGSVFSLDGSFAEPEYVLLASKLNSNNSFGSDVNITNIYYTSDENYFILGIECSVQNFPNQYNFKPDGLGVFLNFSSESGMSAGEPLGYLEEYDFHFLNGASDLWGLMPEDGINFMADFEVDYMFAIYSDGTPNTIIVDASTFIWDKPLNIQHIGASNQTGTSEMGPISDGVFSERSLQFAFQSSTGAESRKGIEIRIPLSEINASPSDVFQVFATMVSSTAYFSDVSIPGNITPGDIGFNPNYNTNQRHDDCGCPNPGATIGTGPYHTDWYTITGINDQELSVPTDYALSQNYPNPFNPLTTIEYQLPEAAEVKLVIFNILGQKINTLLKGKKQAGYHSQVWNASDEFGKSVASGLYIYRLYAKGISGRKFVQVKKMVVLK